MQILKFLHERLHATHLLKMLDKIYKYEMDPTRTVGATERTRDVGQTDVGKTDGWWKNSPIDCEEVQWTNAQCHMVPISILWYTDSWTIQLKYTFETKQERITVSYHPIHHHGHTNFWYVCLLERAHFNYLECSYTIWYVYNKCSIRARPKVFRRKHNIQPTVSALIPWPAFNGMERMCQCHGSN